jgi:ATP-binding cassette subfamily B protein
MKLFTRIDGGTIKKTLVLFRQELSDERKVLLRSSILIPTSHFLYLVLLPLLISYLMQSLIENPHNITTPGFLLVAIVVNGVATVIIQHFAFTAFYKHEERVTTRLTRRAVDDLLKHSSGFFANQKVGSLAGDVNTFSRSYLVLMDTFFLQISSLVVSIVVSLVILAIISPILLIPLLLLTIAIFWEIFYSLQERSIYRNKRKELQSNLFGTIADILGNQTLVRMFGRSKYETARIMHDRQAIEAVAHKEIHIQQRSAEVRMVTLYIFQILTLAVSIYLVTHSMVSIAALVFTVTYLSKISQAMYSVGNIVRTVEQAFLDASKITELLFQAVEVTDVSNAKKLTITKASIKIDNITFGYDADSSNTVFNNFNLEIPVGQSVGLVGRSGGGKSTLTQLLLRYMDVKSGKILIDNKDISQITQESLRSNISYVPQEPYLFHRSLKENISYGNPSASDDQIIAAAKQAYAWEFITKLPNGLDTIVGERGIKLSGGQRQRIAIARAILKDAPILILDEATSALDSESEKYIQQALASLMKHKTTIVVAHRLSTISKLDRIVVLDKGKIAEDGTHMELLTRNGTYSTLWNHQSNGFIDS